MFYAHDKRPEMGVINVQKTNISILTFLFALILNTFKKERNNKVCSSIHFKLTVCKTTRKEDTESRIFSGIKRHNHNRVCSVHFNISHVCPESRFDRNRKPATALCLNKQVLSTETHFLDIKY